MLEGDDDAVSLLQEKEIDNLAGKFSNIFFYLLKVINRHKISEFKIYLLANNCLPIVRTLLSHVNVNNVSHF